MGTKWYNQWAECGSRIKRKRNQMNLSRENLAEMLDVSSKNLERIESGRQATSVDALYRAASVLNTSLDYLLNGVETSPKLSHPEIQGDRQIILELLDECSDLQVQYIRKLICDALIFFNISEERRCDPPK